MESVIVKIKEALAEVEKLDLNPQMKVVLKVLNIIVWILGEVK